MPGTAPEQLARVSSLHGGPVPRVRGCRLLEVGCGHGANLLPLAFYRPHSEFVGVDLSDEALAVAREGATALGLANLDLHRADLAEVGDSLGAFDYVVAHGVLSWVPEEVQRAFFALCRDGLVPEGLAYVSFNAQPGWLVRGLVRDLLRRSCQGAAEARQVAEGLAAVVHAEDGPFAALLRYELDRAARAEDWYVEGEYLAPHNRAFWFHEIESLCASHGLRYLADARFDRPEGEVPVPLRERVGEAGPLGREEVFDLVGYRRFRHAVLCRTGAEAAAAEPVEVEIPAATGASPPVVHALARWEAGRSDRLTTPEHEVLAVDPETASVLVCLDGRRPPEDLVLDEMLAFLEARGVLA